MFSLEQVDPTTESVAQFSFKCRFERPIALDWADEMLTTVSFSRSRGIRNSLATSPFCFHILSFQTLSLSTLESAEVMTSCEFIFYFCLCLRQLRLQPLVRQFGGVRHDAEQICQRMSKSKRQLRNGRAA